MDRVRRTRISHQSPAAPARSEVNASSDADVIGRLEKGARFLVGKRQTRRLEALKAAVPRLADRVRQVTGWDFDAAKVEVEIVPKSDLPQIIGENIRQQTGISLDDWARVYGSGSTLVPKN